MGLFDKLLGRPAAPSPRPAPPAARTAPTPAAIVPEGMRRDAAAEAGLSDFFTQDHRDCDDLWPAVEAAAQGGDGAALQDAWVRFERKLLRHFVMEEEHLFPALEAATGMHGMGPTMVMRSEHEQMRKLLVAMADAVEQGDRQALLDLGDTLLMLIQQHNVKEEGMLYPMAEQALYGHWTDLRDRLPGE